MGTVNSTETTEQRIATIDVQKVVSQSAKIQALNKEQEAKITELEKWLNVVRKDVEKQKTQEGKEKLLNKYRNSYNQKKNAIVSDGQTKMQSIMNDISNTIAAQAKAKKAIVVYGSDDITDDVIKAINGKK